MRLTASKYAQTTLFFLVALPQINDDINIHNFEHDLDIKVKTMLKHSVNFNTAAHGFEVRMRTQTLFFLVALSRVFVINNYPTCTRKFASFLLIAKCALEENALYRVLIFFFFFYDFHEVFNASCIQIAFLSRKLLVKLLSPHKIRTLFIPLHNIFETLREGKKEINLVE